MKPYSKEQAGEAKTSTVYENGANINTYPSKWPGKHLRDFVAELCRRTSNNKKQFSPKQF